MLFNSLRFEDLAGDAFGVETSIASPRRSPKSAEATAAKEPPGSDPSSFEASPDGGFLLPTLLAKSISI